MIRPSFVWAREPLDPHTACQADTFWFNNQEDIPSTVMLLLPS